MIELFERRFPAVPELKTEHDDVVAGLQLSRPKYHSGLDAWGGQGQLLITEEVEVERGRGPRRNSKERSVPALLGPQSDREDRSPDLGGFSI